MYIYIYVDTPVHAVSCPTFDLSCYTVQIFLLFDLLLLIWSKIRNFVHFIYIFFYFWIGQGPWWMLLFLDLIIMESMFQVLERYLILFCNLRIWMSVWTLVFNVFPVSSFWILGYMVGIYELMRDFNDWDRSFLLPIVSPGFFLLLSLLVNFFCYTFDM